MSFFKFLSNPEEIQLDKKTFTSLRSMALFGQLLTVNFVHFYLKFSFPFLESLIIIFLGFLTNIYLQFVIRSNQLNNLKSTLFLFYDLIQLSTLIFLTGGITNPFCILLIIPTIISSTFISFASTLILGMFTLINLTILTFFYLKLPGPVNFIFEVPTYYLFGIFIALFVCLNFLSFFGIRLSQDAIKRNLALKNLEEILAKEHELQSLGGQATAAAHSLNTPLSTISVVASELKKEIGNDKKFSKDIDLLISQTARCSEILKKISNEPTTRDNFFKKIKLKDLLIEIIKSYENISNKKINFNFEKNIEELKINRSVEITYGLRNFIGNAVKYSRSLVNIDLNVKDENIEIKVSDDGPGFSVDVIEILGEPYIRSANTYFSNKSGLGLGTFIGKTLLSRKNAKVYFSNCNKTKGAIVTIKWKVDQLKTA